MSMQPSPTRAHLVQFGPFALDVRSGELLKGSSRLKVPSQSIEILTALLERPGRLVTRDELRARLWPSDTFVDFEHGLNAAVTARDVPPVAVISSTFIDQSPALSDAGDRIAFVSNQSGSYAIWVASADGSHPMSVTNFPRAFTGSPRWNADGTWIAFDSNVSGSWNVYRVSAAQGGDAIAVTHEASNNARPSWSRDGRSIYFASTRTGSWEIWKTPVDGGGAAVRMTYDGGLEAQESSDGRDLYFAKPNPLTGGRGIWRIPVGGGSARQIIDHGTATSWGVTDAGLVLMDKFTNPATVEYFDFDGRAIVPIFRLPLGLRLDRANPSFAVSRDARWMLYVRDQDVADIHMLMLR